jgi:hypothetical protein
MLGPLWSGFVYKVDLRYPFWMAAVLMMSVSFLTLRMRREERPVINHPNSPRGDHPTSPSLLVPLLAAGPVEPVGSALSALSKELWEKHLGLFP